MMRVFVGLTALLISNLAAAQDNYTDAYYEIRDLIIFSKVEPVHPAWAGYVQVRFTQPLVWVVPNTCNTGSAAIRPEDTHIIAAIQTAWKMGRNLRLFADDSQRIDGSYCILRAVQIG